MLCPPSGPARLRPALLVPDVLPVVNDERQRLLQDLGPQLVIQEPVYNPCMRSTSTQSGPGVRFRRIGRRAGMACSAEPVGGQVSQGFLPSPRSKVRHKDLRWSPVDIGAMMTWQMRPGRCDPEMSLPSGSSCRHA